MQEITALLEMLYKLLLNPECLQERAKEYFKSSQINFTWTSWPLLLKRKEQNMPIKEQEEKKFCKSRTSSLNVYSGSSAFACSNGKLIEKQTIWTTSVTFLKWVFFLPLPPYHPFSFQCSWTAPLLSYMHSLFLTKLEAQWYEFTIARD